MELNAWQRDVLARGELFRVGGTVRDRLLGIEGTAPDDDYVVRGFPPEELESLLRRHGKLVLVGRSFGAYRFIPRDGGATVDIVYPRTERSTGPGHREFRVRWDWRLPLEDDLVRRDFTINAIAQDVRDDSLRDPVGGAEDVRRRVLRMIFPEAFDEDPLRVLRGIRFAAQFDLRIDPDTLRRMREAGASVSTVSAERVRDELTKLMQRCDHPSRGLALAHDLGALAVVLPELDRAAGVEQNEYHPDDVFVHSLKTCDAAPRTRLVVRWAALLHDVGKVDTRREVSDERGTRVVFYGHEHVGAEMTRRILTRLRYPRLFVEHCSALVEHHMFQYVSEWTDATVRRFIRRVGEGRVEGLFALREADCRSRDIAAGIVEVDELRRRVQGELAARAAFDRRDLAITGDDVVAATGLEPGPAVGALLERLVETVIETPALNERDALLELVQSWTDGES